MDLTTPTASDGPPVSPATLTPAPSSYRIRVETSPPVARLSIDDLVVPNPYVADKEPDGAPHVVRAEAPGYIAKTSTLRFDANTALQLALEREPSHVSDVRPASVWAVRATLPSALPSSLPPAAAPLRTPLEAPPSKPKREVDKENPYGP
jgi:serine/threonine-protein kinase